MFLVDYECADKQNRMVGYRESNSRLSKCNLDQKHNIVGTQYSPTSSHNSDEEQFSDEEFKQRRKSLRSKNNRGGA